MDQDRTASTEAQPDEPDGRGMGMLIAGIPGADGRLTLARDEIARGDGIPLDEAFSD